MGTSTIHGRNSFKNSIQTKDLNKATNLEDNFFEDIQIGNNGFYGWWETNSMNWLSNEHVYNTLKLVSKVVICVDSK